MSKIEQNKEKKREVILEAAKDIFLSEGYVFTSMNRIATKAHVTKQTIYRYYASKADLFEAVLSEMGKNSEMSFLDYLQESNVEVALYKFARGFIMSHLSQEHLYTFRLLVTESAKAPELTSSFFAVGSDKTDVQLAEFFTQRLGVKNAETTVQLWTAMLLAHRMNVLVGMEIPSHNKIEEYAKDATDFLLASIGGDQ